MSVFQRSPDLPVSSRVSGSPLNGWTFNNWKWQFDQPQSGHQETSWVTDRYDDYRLNEQRGDWQDKYTYLGKANGNVYPFTYYQYREPSSGHWVYADPVVDDRIVKRRRFRRRNFSRRR